MKRKTKTNSENFLFPVKFDDKDYHEKDCDELFLCFYHDRAALNDEGGVYMTEGVWIYPDGSTEEY